MANEFDPGYAAEPFRTLCMEYPGSDVYPQADFRVEWGPIFHRGRLDGSARILVIGQDPALNENVLRRILVGVAGQRAQGLLKKLGLTRSYVMINTFLYSVYGRASGQNDPEIVSYRNRWIDAIFGTSQIEAVLTLGSLADGAWKKWKSANPRDPHRNLSGSCRPSGVGSLQPGAGGAYLGDTTHIAPILRPPWTSRSPT